MAEGGEAVARRLETAVWLIVVVVAAFVAWTGWRLWSDVVTRD
mgnify:CR=1